MHALRAIPLLAGAGLWLAGCGLQPEAVALPPIVAPAGAALPDAAEITDRSAGRAQRAYDLSAQVNALRSGAGRPALRWNGALFRVALARARTLASAPACWVPEPAACARQAAFIERLNAAGYPYDRAVALSHVALEDGWNAAGAATAWDKRQRAQLLDRVVAEVGAAVVSAGPLTVSVVVLGRQRPSSGS